MLEFYLRMALIFIEQEVGLNHVQCWKSVNIKGISQ